LRYAAPQRVPASGTRYLQAGGVVTSDLGDRLTTDATLRGIAISVDVADATNDYDVDVVSDPAGSPSVLGTLSFTSGNTEDARRDLSASISDGTIIGVRLVRSAGSGRSDFTNIIVIVEVSIP